eukprot:TRINITY_DN29231_c0_g1_i1.p1 TRINITY_DN29231_c0_g1~~TRINITY_DN29231_c0_g1_i1.p1  ORF type:complete len:1583 (+),score=413.28 TRINITY_DN29231_c0_g1_i1:72-4820(+)
MADLALLVTAVLGAQTCASSLRGCMYQKSGVPFGDTAYSLATGKDLDLPLGSETLKSMCSRENWRRSDSCTEECGLQMVVKEPAHMRMSMCVTDSDLRPFLPDAHMDMSDPRLQQDFELIAPGSPTRPHARMGCSLASFMDGRSYKGKTALISRGGCVFNIKMLFARLLGAKAGVVVNISPSRSVLNNHFLIIGLSLGTENSPFMSMPKHFGDELFAALDAGETVKIGFNLSCPYTKGSGSTYQGDDCPHPGMIGKCQHMPELEDRLCSQCAMKITHTSHPSLQACLRSSTLLPRIPENQLWTSNAPPTSLDVDYLPQVSGCSAQEFAPFAGRVVMLLAPVACLPFRSIRIAQAAGVSGVLFLSDKQTPVTASIEGPSQLVRIPVHVLEPKDWVAIDTAFRQSGTLSTQGTGSVTVYTLQVSGVAGDTAPYVPYIPPPTPVPSMMAVVEEDKQAAFEASPIVVTCIVVIVLLLGACAWKIYQQKKSAIALPESGGSSRVLIPLSVASMGLSLTLLVVTAFVAFGLTFASGERAKDTAVEDGKRASNENYQGAVANVDALASKLRDNVGSQVRQGLDDLLDKGESMASSVASLYFEADTTWDACNREYNKFIQIMFRSPLWRPAVMTKNRYQFGRAWKTSEQLGTLPHISTVNDGSNYGLTTQTYNPVTRMMVPVTQYTPSPFGMFARIANFFGDPIALTKDLPNEFMRWQLIPDNYLNEGHEGQWYVNPLSVYSPIYNRHSEYLGFVVADVRLGDIGTILKSASSAENMTTVVFDATNMNVVATPQYDITRPYIAKFFGVYGPAHRLYKLGRLPPVEIRSLERYFTANGGGDFSTEFDQQDWYQDPEYAYSVMNVVAADSGEVTDSGEYVFKMEMRGPCASSGGCVLQEDGANILRFGGSDTLYVYKNLSLDSPDVVAKRTSPPGQPYTTDYRPYQLHKAIPGTLGISDAERCVNHQSGQAAIPPLCSVKSPFLESSFTVYVRFRTVADVDPSDLDQVLLSDSEQGESIIRLHASGILMIGVTTYSCRTAPLQETVRGGRWHTYVVTLDRRAKTCSLYVNGVHHSSGQISKREGLHDYAFSQAATPYVAGLGLVGDIARLQIWDMILAQQEIEGLHKTDRFTRYVPSRVWFADLWQFSRNTRKSAEIDWRVSVMIPRADIMRQVDANNAATQSSLAVRAENLRKKLRQESSETALIICAIALLSVFIFLVFNDALTKPFARVAVVMADAAVMQVDEIPNETSIILELHAMQRAMVLMLKNLKEYRSYMPQSVLADTEDEGSTHTASDQGTETKSASKSHRSTTSRQSKATTRVDDIATKRAGMALSLAKKRVSFTVMNMCDWQKRVSSLSTKETLALHSVVLQTIIGVCRLQKGISEVFSGDRFLSSFNGAKNNPLHRCAATEVALSSIESVKEFSIGLSCSVVTGEVRAGNMGCEDMKRYSFVGPVLTWAYALERYARFMDIPVVCDRFLALEIQTSFKMRLIGSANFPKRCADEIRLHEVQEAVQEGSNDEWMYQLEAAEAADPNVQWNKFVEHILKQSWDEATSLLGTAREIDSKSKVMRQLESALERRNYVPDEIPFH